MAEFGRLLLIIGLATAFCGLIILVATRFMPWLGNLPGDLHIEGERYKIYFPLATMILVSIIGTVLLNIVLRIFRR